jgi:hypothetical protein
MPRIGLGKKRSHPGPRAVVVHAPTAIGTRLPDAGNGWLVLKPGTRLNVRPYVHRRQPVVSMHASAVWPSSTSSEKPRYTPYRLPVWLN